MSAKGKSLRSPLARVRGLGSARRGTGHWWGQRLTALALIPLSIYIVVTFCTEAVLGGYENALGWLSSPFVALPVILFLGVGFHHAASGLQTVTEDYVHHEGLKLACIIAIRFLAVALAVLGMLAVIKVLLLTNVVTPPDAQGS